MLWATFAVDGSHQKFVVEPSTSKKRFNDWIKFRCMDVLLPTMGMRLSKHGSLLYWMRQPQSSGKIIAQQYQMHLEHPQDES